MNPTMPTTCCTSDVSRAEPLPADLTARICDDRGGAPQASAGVEGAEHRDGGASSSLSSWSRGVTILDGEVVDNLEEYLQLYAQHRLVGHALMQAIPLMHVYMYIYTHTQNTCNSTLNM